LVRPCRVNPLSKDKIPKQLALSLWFSLGFFFGTGLHTSIAASASILSSLSTPHEGCSFWSGPIHKTQLKPTRFGSITLFALPKPERLPNAVYASSDGSVWFGEWAVPGVGHLYPNGTLIEYSWQLPYHAEQIEVPSLCGARTYIWGVQYWQERVWASDSQGSRLIGVDPSTGGVMRVKLPNNNSSPYSLTTGPNDSLVHGALLVEDRLAQHITSDLEFYNFTDKSLTTFPTSTVGHAPTTLPYFVKSNGSLIWFNEHYADRIGVINTAQGTLTEYSVVERRPTSLGNVSDTETFDVGGNRVWFAQLSSNAAGFVDAAESPDFSLRALNGTSGNKALALHPGDKVDLELNLTGRSSASTEFEASDSETQYSTPKIITITAEQSVIPALMGSQTVSVTISGGPTVLPGKYTILVTATDGLLSAPVYIPLDVI
jgi:streptogramin lyase